MLYVACGICKCVGVRVINCSSQIIKYEYNSLAISMFICRYCYSSV